MKGDSNPRLRRAIGNALKDVDRAACPTQRLLAFSPLQPRAPQPFDADRLIAGMSELFKRTSGEMIHPETVIAPGLWRVEADTNRLESALVMPMMSARELADASHLIRPQLKVLYTNGYTRNAIVHGGRLDSGRPGNCMR